MNSFLYISKYDSANLRGIDESPRPWNLDNEIIQYSNKDYSLLDIGCGTSFKLLSLASHFKRIMGIDISEDMVRASKDIIKKNNIPNISIMQCDSQKLPFEDNSYDIVTCMVSRWSVKEIHRVLKPTGIAIIEHIGCEDKKDFKILFGKDELGWRGQFIEFEKDEYLSHYYSMFDSYFSDISIQNGFWKTRYTKQGILELLKFTPTIRNFDAEKDTAALERGYEIFKCPNGISLVQNRILIHAKNPRIF